MLTKISTYRETMYKCPQCLRIVKEDTTQKCLIFGKKRITESIFCSCPICGYSHFKSIKYVFTYRCQCGNLVFSENIKDTENETCDDCLNKKKRESPTYSHNWSLAVRTRDNFICQSCCASNVPLHAHHLYDQQRFPSLDGDIGNGIALCVKCHMDFHAWMGGNAIPCTPNDFYNWLHNYSIILEEELIDDDRDRLSITQEDGSQDESPEEKIGKTKFTNIFSGKSWYS